MNDLELFMQVWTSCLHIHVKNLCLVHCCGWCVVGIQDQSWTVLFHFCKLKQLIFSSLIPEWVRRSETISNNYIISLRVATVDKKSLLIAHVPVCVQANTHTHMCVCIYICKSMMINVCICCVNVFMCLFSSACFSPTCRFWCDLFLWIHDEHDWKTRDPSKGCKGDLDPSRGHQRGPSHWNH